jgi:diguanylate cyclase (GGDEF)-like protein
MTTPNRDNLEQGNGTPENGNTGHHGSGSETPMQKTSSWGKKWEELPEEIKPTQEELNTIKTLGIDPQKYIHGLALRVKRRAIALEEYEKELQEGKTKERKKPEDKTPEEIKRDVMRRIASAIHTKEEKTKAGRRGEKTSAQDVAARAKVSGIDLLTGLANRHGKKRAVQREAKRLLRQKGVDIRGAVMMVDLDHFKKINDIYGHEVGDEVLACVGEALRELRGSDIPVRYGGEEFQVILFHADTSTEMTDKKRAQIVAQKVSARINQLIREKVKDPKTGGGLNVTASIGVAEFSVPNQEQKDGRPVTSVEDVESAVENALQEADVAVYVAKITGRNKTVVRDEVTAEQMEEVVRARREKIAATEARIFPHAAKEKQEGKE